MNLLKETEGKIKAHNKDTKDVLWVGNLIAKSTWEDFASNANFNYDNGFGGEEIFTDLLIVGDSWWLERHEYDGSEWWEFKEQPKEPEKLIKITTLKQDCYDDFDQINNGENNE